MNVMNMVMKEYCATKRYLESDSFYFDKTVSDSLNSSILISKPGYYQSVRVLGKGLKLIVDYMKAPFYKPDLTLLKVWFESKRLNYIPECSKQLFTNLRSTWTEEQAHAAGQYWKNLQIKSTHKNENNMFTIYEVIGGSAHTTKITGMYEFRGQSGTFLPEHPFESLTTFIMERYGLDAELLEPHMPVIKVSPQKNYFLPWGCCLTTDESHYLSKVENVELLKQLQSGPDKRKTAIEDWIVGRLQEDLERYRNPSCSSLPNLHMPYVCMYSFLSFVF